MSISSLLLYVRGLVQADTQAQSARPTPAARPTCTAGAPARQGASPTTSRPPHALRGAPAEAAERGEGRLEDKALPTLHVMGAFDHAPARAPALKDAGRCEDTVTVASPPAWAPIPGPCPGIHSDAASDSGSSGGCD